jgi:hypothetical protein
MCAASYVPSLFGISSGPTFSFLILVSVITRGIPQFLVSSPPLKGWTQPRETIWQGSPVFHFFFAHSCRLCSLRDTRRRLPSIRLRIHPRAFLSPCIPLSFYSTSGSVLLPFLDAYVRMSGSLIMQSLSSFLILPQRPPAWNPPPYPSVHSVDIEVGHFM